MHQSRCVSWGTGEKAFSGHKSGGWRNGNSHSEGNGGKPGRCHRCGIRHWKSDCGDETPAGKRWDRKPIRCQNSGKACHWKDQCWKPHRILNEDKSDDSEEDDSQKQSQNTQSKRDTNRSFKDRANVTKHIKQSYYVSHGEKSRINGNEEGFIWIGDSGTNVHVCGRRDWFTSYEEFDVPNKLEIASKVLEDSPKKGTVSMMALIRNQWEVIELKDTLYLPGGANLFSYSAVLKKGYAAQNTSRGTTFYNKEGRESIRARLEMDGMQVMMFKPLEKVRRMKSAVESKAPCWQDKDDTKNKVLVTPVAAEENTSKERTRNLVHEVQDVQEAQIFQKHSVQTEEQHAEHVEGQNGQNEARIGIQNKEIPILREKKGHLPLWDGKGDLRTLTEKLGPRKRESLQRKMSVSKKLRVALNWLAVYMLTFRTLEKRLWKQKPEEPDGWIQHMKPNLWMAVMLRTGGLRSIGWITIGLIMKRKKKIEEEEKDLEDSHFSNEITWSPTEVLTIVFWSNPDYYRMWIPDFLL